MSAYTAVLSARFRTLLQYRAAAAAGLATQVFWGLIRVMIFDAFYRSSSSPQPMAYVEVVTYIWLGQATIRLLPWSPEPEVRGMIRGGTIAYEMLRPLDVYRLWYCRSVAFLAAPTLLRAIPLFVLAALFFGMQAPASPGAALAFGASILSALFLSAALVTLLSIILLWTLSGEGISRLLPAAGWIFSGMIIPLPLFPEWMQSVVNFLPFRGLMDTPFRLYLGHLPVEQAAGALAHQLAWTALLILAGRALLARGLRRLVIQGG